MRRFKTDVVVCDEFGVDYTCTVYVERDECDSTDDYAGYVLYDVDFIECTDEDGNVYKTMPEGITEEDIINVLEQED